MLNIGLSLCIARAFAVAALAILVFVQREPHVIVAPDRTIELCRLDLAAFKSAFQTRPERFDSLAL